MNEDFTVITTQDIKELRDSIHEFQGRVKHSPEGFREACMVINKAKELLENMIKSTERHS